MASVAITVKGAPGETLPLAPGLVTTIEATLGAATRAAGTVALSSVELTKLVASALPSSETCEPDTKLTPLTARLKAATPASTEAGESEPMAGLTTLNGSALEAAAPGLTTCTLNWPVLDTRLAGTIAVSELELMNVVASAVEFNETCEPEAKLAPVTARVKAAEPTGTLVGEMLPRLRAAVTVNVTTLESEPPGLTTCTLTTPGVASRLAGTVAVNVVLLTNVAASAAPLNDTCDPDRKLAPATVSAKAAEPPERSEEGRVGKE